MSAASLFDKISEMAPSISTVVGSSWAPVPKRVVYETFGCGHFGCVLATEQSKVVLKVTTDPHEAMAARIFAEVGAKDGITRYHRVMWSPNSGRRRKIMVRELRELKLWTQLPGVFLLWREEASGFGRVLTGAGETRFFDARMDAREIGERALSQRDRLWKDLLKGEDPRDVSATRSKLIRAFLRYVSQLEDAGKKGSNARTVADEMLFWAEDWGLLVGDVHRDNVAFAQRGSRQVPVITDPGVSVLLSPMWDKLSIEAL